MLNTAVKLGASLKAIETHTVPMLLDTPVHDVFDLLAKNRPLKLTTMTVRELQASHQSLLSERSAKLIEEAERRDIHSKQHPNSNVSFMKTPSFLRHFYFVYKIENEIFSKVRDSPVELIQLYTGRPGDIQFHVPLQGGFVTPIAPTNPPYPQLEFCDRFALAANLVTHLPQHILSLQHLLITEPNKNESSAVWDYLFSDYTRIVQLEQEVCKNAGDKHKAWTIPLAIREKYEKRAIQHNAAAGVM
jgi:hypothetical protein